MIAFKHSAFAYEKEVRCVHVVNEERTSTHARFVDLGGVSGDAEVPGESVGFEIRENHLSAFLDLPLPKSSADGGGFLAEIVVGPKNGSLPGNVQLFLG